MPPASAWRPTSSNVSANTGNADRSTSMASAFLTPSAEELTDPEYWVRHARQPVRFAEAMHTFDVRGIAEHQPNQSRFLSQPTIDSARPRSHADAGPSITDANSMTCTASRECGCCRISIEAEAQRRSVLSRYGGVLPPEAAGSSALDTRRTEGRSPPSAATAEPGPGPRPYGPWR
jgi:hypothetical protein